MADQNATASRLVLAKAHRTITEGAEVSKRAIAAHRRALRAQLAALEELERTCTELGIELQIQNGTAPKEGTANDRSGPH